MHFDSMNAFWAMGGYGLYVWLSFGLGFLCLALLWLDSVWSKRKLFKQVLTEQVRLARIKAATSQ